MMDIIKFLKNKFSKKKKISFFTKHYETFIKLMDNRDQFIDIESLNLKSKDIKELRIALKKKNHKIIVSDSKKEIKISKIEKKKEGWRD